MEHSNNKQDQVPNDDRSFRRQVDGVNGEDNPNSLLPQMLARLGMGRNPLPPGSETRVDQLVAALKNREWSIRVAALQALGKMGDRAPIEPLVDALHDENELTRAAAVRALGSLWRRAPIEPLVAALHDSSWRVRADAALALGMLGERAPIEPLANAIHDEDGSVCTAAVQALGAMGKRAPIEPLVIALHDQEWYVREAAALVLGKQGKRAPVDDLRAALHDKDASVCNAAMLALQQAYPAVASDITSEMPTSQLEPLEQTPSLQTQQDNMVGPEVPGDRQAPLPDSERLYSIFSTLRLRHPHTDQSQGAPEDIDLAGVYPNQLTPSSRPAERHGVTGPIRFRQRVFPPGRGRVRRVVERGIAVLAVAAIIIAFLAATLIGSLRGNGNQGHKIVRSNVAFCSQGVGCAYFISSNPAIDTGVNDELQINLHSVPDPATGKSYYAWLLGNQNNAEAPAILLSRLQVRQGSLKFLYQGHTNLLVSYSRFLITEENSNISPLNPSLAPSTWRYYIAFSQTPDPQDTVNHYSVFDHLQHLLAKDPQLEELGLHNGLSTWLLRNTQQIVAWANTAKRASAGKNTQFIRSQLIRILDYLDGQAYVQRDVPPGTPLLVDQTIARVALLELDPEQQIPPGYLDHIGIHLRAINQNPDATAYQKGLANQINDALNKVNDELEKVRQDARLLVNMTNAQLLQPSSLSTLNDMLAQANDGYNGQINSSTRQVQQEGVVQIYQDIQRLATFDVQPFKQ